MSRLPSCLVWVCLAGVLCPACEAPGGGPTAADGLTEVSVPGDADPPATGEVGPADDAAPTDTTTDAPEPDVVDDRPLSPVPTGALQAPPGVFRLEATCEPGGVETPDPLVQLWQHRANSWAPHLYDVAADPDRDIIFPSGLPGLFVVDISGGEYVFRDRWPPDNEWDTPFKFDKVSLMDNHIIAATYQGLPFGGVPDFQAELPDAGLTLLDVSDPFAIDDFVFVPWDGAAATTSIHPYLYLSTIKGELLTWDVTDPTDPELVGIDKNHIKGPRELDVHSGGGLYVADVYAGLLVYDVTQPDAPVFVGEIPASGAPQHLDVEGDILAVGLGAAGVQTFWLEDPLAPQPLDTIDIFASATGVAIEQERIWVAAHTATVLLDMADPSQLVPLARHDVFSVVLAVEAIGSRAFLQDWDYFEVIEYTPGPPAPQVWQLTPGAWLSAEGTAHVEFTNAGNAPLELTGLASPDPKLNLWVDRLVVHPGEVGTIRVGVDDADSGEPVPETTLCLVTNSSGAPVMEVDVARVSDQTGAALQVGQVAPPFTLTDLDGNSHSLSDYEGQPVLITSFSTWCPVCIPIIVDMESTLWQPYMDEGIMVLGIGGHTEDAAALNTLRDQLSITFPILYDPTQEVIDDYAAKTQYQILPYPHDFVISPEGIVDHIEGHYDPDTIIKLFDKYLEDPTWQQADP